jgi:endonuclease I
MMKKIEFLLLFLFAGIFSLSAQKAGYYSGAEGKTGTELKSALHEIIKSHVDFSYSDAKFILNYADSDPANENNVILIYTRRSQSNTTWGSGGDFINREHVWAKSHGSFVDIRPMDGDAFNLHPADASVNISRSNYDFDECSASGTLIAEANAYYTSTQFEPQDAAKGEVARTLFYMAVRYEGTDNEIDLEMIDQVSNYPNPKFGKLSTLLQWNNDFPPTDNERRRNERVYDAQRNRNPFIDHPEYADMIWADEAASSISFGNLSMSPEFPGIGESASITAAINSASGTISSATLYYGTTYNSEANAAVMTNNGGVWSGNIDFSPFAANDYVYYKIIASDGSNTASATGNYRIPVVKTFSGIETVQGTGATSPLTGSVVTLAGIVTANLDNTYYIQSSGDPNSGICIFDIRRGKIGDSIVVTGNVSEYNTLTEIDKISYFYNYGQKRLIEPTVLTIGQLNESHEGMLVTFKEVTFLDGDKLIPLTANANLTFTDGASSMIVYARYNSRISGKVLPSGTVDVTGVISQYAGTYQLLVNDISDIKSGFDNEAPIITGVVANDKDWIEVSFNEKIDQTSAETVSNYSFSGGLSISGAYLYGGTKVLLLVTGIQQIDYTLTVNGIKDLQGNTIVNASKDFHSNFEDPGFKPIECNSDSVSTAYHITVHIEVLANDSLPDIFNFSVVGQPKYGNLTIESDLSLTYVSTFDELENVYDTIIYQVCHENDPVNCFQAEVFITVFPTLSINEKGSVQVEIYPNPVYGKLFIKATQLIEFIEILDITGKNLYQHAPLNSVFSLQMPESNGIYFVRIRLNSGETITRKLVKQ